MRPFKITIEFGEQLYQTQVGTPSQIVTAPVVPREVESSNDGVVSSLDTDAAWEILLEARRNMKAETIENRHDVAKEINTWIGGGLAVLGVLTGESSAALLEKLSAEIPILSAEEAMKQPGRPKFVETKRERPKPHPGAPRPINIDELTPEEREELGIIEPDMEIPESEPTIVVTDPNS